MDCESALGLISSQIDGETEAGDRSALESHLASCESCREALEGLRRQDADLRRAFQPRREAARALAARVIRRIEGESFRWPARRFVLSLALAAAAGFALAAVIFYQPRPQIPAGGGPLASPAPPVHAPAAIELVWATTPIQVLRPAAAAWEPVVPGGRVAPGSRVRTGNKVLCEFRTPDGSEVRLNADSELAFHSARSIELGRGQVFSSVAEALEPYEVSVPREETRVVALGTQFDVQLEEGATVLTVVQGVTRVDGPGGAELATLGVRERARIVKGRIDKRSRVESLELATGWVNEILAMKGPDNPEFKRRIDNLLAQIGETKMTHLYEEQIVKLGDHCVRPIAKFLESDLSRERERKHLRANAARILQKIAPKWAIGDLIPLLGDAEPDVRYWVAKSLEELTRVNQGLSPERWRDLPAAEREETLKRWRAWWEENREQYPSPPF